MDEDIKETVTSVVYSKSLSLFQRDFSRGVNHTLVGFLLAQEPPMLNEDDKEMLETCRTGRERVATLFDMLQTVNDSEVIFIKYLKQCHASQPQLVKKLEDVKEQELQKRGLPSDQGVPAGASQQVATGLLPPASSPKMPCLITEDKVHPLLKLIINKEIAVGDWMTVVDEMKIKGAERTSINELLSTDKREAVRNTLMKYITKRDNPPVDDFIKILSECELGSLAGEITRKKDEIWK